MNLIIARSATRRTCSTKASCRAIFRREIDRRNQSECYSPGRPLDHVGSEEIFAVDAFEAQYRLAELARESEKTWQSADALLLPSAGTIYTIEQILASPIELNSNLGRYTNFMNLLDPVESQSPAGFGLTEFLSE